MDFQGEEQVSESLPVVGESKAGSGVSSQRLHHSARRLTSGTSRVAHINIALSMTGGEGAEGTACAGRASSEESVSLLTIDGRTSATSNGTL